MTSQNIHFPYPSNGRTLTSFEWRAIRYRNVISILKNSFYAGVYAYGKSETHASIVDGRARKSYGHHKPMDAWEVFIKDHHEGYMGAIRRFLPAITTVGLATQSPDEADAPCWAVSSVAHAVAVDSALPTPAAIPCQFTGATS